MKILYFDCFSGISGDMTLAALLDLGVGKEQLVNELKKIHLHGWEIELSETAKHGIGAKHVEVILEDEKHSHHGHHHHHEHTPDHGHHHHDGHEHHHHHHGEHGHVHRNMSDIARMIDDSGISEGAKDLAKRIFMRLAIAEAKVHGTTPDKVHFHEVGAVDSIIDIVGTAICIDILSPDQVYSSVLHDGYGFVNCQHGMIPVPVPAVTEVLANAGVSFKQLDIEGEMMTPTGAAIVTELAQRFGPMPEMKVVKTGYGAGKKDFPIPNILRVVMGEAVSSAGSDRVTVIETNIDDTTPEIMGYVMDKLLQAGARDVFFTPVYMKKGRPATMISIICDNSAVAVMEDILFRETSTIGVRKHEVARTCLPRKAVTIPTPYGEVKAKETHYKEVKRLTLEYDDACRLAKENGVSLKDIYGSL